MNLVVPKGETYGNVTPEQWRAGLRYAAILCDRFTNDLPSWVDQDGFQGAALDGLMRAARAHQPQRGAFSTIMTPAINRSLMREWVEQQNRVRGRPKSSRFWEDPEVIALGEEGRIVHPISLDFQTTEDGDRMSDLQAGSERPDAEVLARFDAEVAQARLARVLAALPPHESAVLQQRAAGRTLLEIGRERGVSRERVRQIEQAALRKARQTAERLGLRQ